MYLTQAETRGRVKELDATSVVQNNLVSRSSIYVTIYPRAYS
jgi:hypothetical protein